jgi:hypothetical protein
MDNGFGPIILVVNLARLEQAMRCFWAAKKVYFECILDLIWSPINEYEFGSYEVKVDLS